MPNIMKRLTVRSVSEDTIEQLRVLHRETRLPLALLIEDAVELLWGQYEAEGYDLDDQFDEAA